MRALVLAGANVGARDSAGYTPLHAAARRGAAEVVGDLLARGAPASACTERGDTPLHFAALAGGMGTIDVLLDAGADRDARNAAGAVPAEVAPKASVKHRLAPTPTHRPANRPPSVRARSSSHASSQAGSQACSQPASRSPSRPESGGSPSGRFVRRQHQSASVGAGPGAAVGNCSAASGGGSRPTYQREPQPPLSSPPPLGPRTAPLPMPPAMAVRLQQHGTGSMRLATPSADEVREQVEAQLRLDRAGMAGAGGSPGVLGDSDESRKFTAKRNDKRRWQSNFMAKYGLQAKKDLFAPFGSG